MTESLWHRMTVPCNHCGHGVVEPVMNGPLVRRLRMKRGITLREMARTVGISPAYLSDIEHEKRYLRNGTIVVKIRTALEASDE